MSRKMFQKEFIGLKDMNGCEVHEGDHIAIKLKDRNGEYSYTLLSGIVEYQAISTRFVGCCFGIRHGTTFYLLSNLAGLDDYQIELVSSKSESNAA